MQNDYQEPAAGRKQKQAEKSDRMRKEILLAAVCCLHENGYHRASIKKITERTGFSQGALQHHFRTKEDLMVFVLERLLSKSLRLTLEWLAEIKGQNEKISEITTRWWTNQANSPEYLSMLEILAAARTEQTLRRRIKPTFDTFARETDERVSAIFAESRVSVGTAHMLITATRNMMTGLVSADGLFMSEREKMRYVEQWGRFLQHLITQGAAL